MSCGKRAVAWIIDAMVWKAPLAITVVALLLSACSVPVCCPPKPEATELSVLESAHAHQARLAGLDDWSLKGRIGLIRGDEGWHAGLDWVQQGEAYQIQLDGPIGQAAMRLIGDPNGITLLIPDKAPMSADSPDALIRDAMGFQLPVSGLRWWITGRMQPGANAVSTLDDAGRIKEIRQDGWLVRFLDYQRVGDELDLPRKMRLEHPEVTIKLVLREWHVGAPSP